MHEAQDGTPKPRTILGITAVVLVLAVLAYRGHQAAVTDVVETLYGRILAKPPLRLADYRTGIGRFGRSRVILNRWRSLDGPTIDLLEHPVTLPLPLRVTRTLRVANPVDLRKRAAAVFARDLAALSARQVAGGTVSDWEREIYTWGAAEFGYPYKP
jgi:hypothetical protein